jgi:D-alanyl-D-alanine carboxypeptidase
MTLERFARLGPQMLAPLLLAAALVLVGLSGPAHAKRQYTGIVVDAATGQVLYDYRPDTLIYPASLTKLMTLYLTFEALRDGRLGMEQRLPVSQRAAGMPASKLGLKRGGSIKVRDAILSLIVKSANDAAVVLAESMAKTEILFAREMTEKAQELGMIRTSFRNANGLPNRHQKSTARDISTLALALIRDFPEYYDLFATRKFTWEGRTYTSTNKLLNGYPGVDGLKTGYINASGFNLAASSVRYGRRLVAVVIGGQTGARRNRQMKKILGIGFQRALEREKARQLVAMPLPPGRPGTGAPSSALAGIDLSVVSSAHAAVPPPPARRADDAPYGVQVGAFSSQKRATAGARLAVSAAPTYLQNRPVAIESIPDTVRSIYRARILELTRDEARETCETLKSKRLDCLVVKAAAGG